MSFEEWFFSYYGTDPAYFPESADLRESWNAATEAANKKHERTFQALENALHYRDGTKPHDWAIQHYIATKAAQENK